MVATPSGMSSSPEKHVPSNDLRPITVTLAGISSVPVNLVFKNACPGIVVNAPLRGRCSVPVYPQFANALSPIVATESGMTRSPESLLA